MEGLIQQCDKLWNRYYVTRRCHLQG